MIAATVIAVLTLAGLAAWWLIARDKSTEIANLRRALDAHRAYEADLNAILNRRHGTVYSCPYCDHDLVREPFNFYCLHCQASVSDPQVAMEATDD